MASIRSLNMESISSFLDPLLGTTAESEGAKVSGGKKKKVTVDSSEEGVVKALTGFLKTKEKELKDKLGTKQKEKEDIDAKIKDLIKKARTLQSTTGRLAEKYEATVNKNRSEVVDDYRKLITKIKLLDFIEKFEVDSEKRILFTTVPISVQKKTWLKPKKAGRYQIRIDFKKGNISEGIQGINIDQHYREYDHPNIRDAKFCYGSKLAIDVEQEYREQDLYELVIDLVDLLRSPNDQDGFTRWGYFFKGAKKRPKGYSFVKHDQRDIDAGATHEWTTYNFQQMAVAPNVAYWNDTLSNTYSSMASTATQYYGGFQQRNERESITIHLLRLGFVDHRTAQYYTDRILQRTRGLAPSSIDLRRMSSDPNSDAELYYRFHTDYAVSASMSTAPPPPAEIVDRIMVPANLLRPEGSAGPDPEAITRMEREMAEDRQRMEENMRNEAARLQEQQRNLVSSLAQTPPFLVDENEDSNSS